MPSLLLRDGLASSVAVPGASGIVYKAAEHRDERSAAFRLVYHAYARAGLIEPNPSQLRVTPYQLQPSSTIFLALLRDEVISTVSLIGDSPLGLPMESIYGEEVAGLRAAGVRFGEVSALADRRRQMSRTLPVFVELVYKAASCQADRMAAFRLVYQAYLRAGLIEPNPYEMRVTPYHLLPTTDIFLALDGDRPIATASLVRDGEAGLPCETLFPLEAARRRRQGLKLGEASSLALAATDLPKKLVLIGVMRLLAQAARRWRIDELLATVHPRHASFYQNVLTFEKFGSPAPHRQLRNHPALGLTLSFPRIDERRPRAYGLFFDARLSDSLFEPSPISQAERDFFGPAAAHGGHFTLRAGADGRALRPAA